MNNSNCVFLFVVMISAFGLISPYQSSGQQPRGVHFAVKIRQKPITEHRSIYMKIAKDTSVLQSKPLQKAMVQSCIKDWYGKYIRHNELESVNDGIPLERGTTDAFSYFWTFVSRFDANPKTIECWMKIMEGPAWASKAEDRMIRKMKLNGRTSIRIFLKEAKIRSNKRKSPQQKKRPQNFRKISSFGTLPQAFFEVAKLNWKYFDLDTKQRVKQFAWQVIKSKESMGGWKQFSTTLLNDIGIKKEKINQKLKVQPNKIQNGGVIPERIVKKYTMKNITKWQKEYPEWPVDKSEVNTALPEDLELEDFEEGIKKDDEEDESDAGPPEDPPGKGPQDDGAEDDNDGDDERESNPRNDKGKKED
ncbi:MAG: hypothetical protein ABEH43_00645 [Flavobacteriales bacterium]